MRVQVYRRLRAAVEDGIRHGIGSYNKYASDPLTNEQAEALFEHVDREIVNEIDEWFECDEYRDG